MIILFLCVFLLGTVGASFANVIIYRYPRQMDFVKGRSICPYCHHTLHFYDLIPILSFIMLHGKCRYCSYPIPFRDHICEWIGGWVACLCYFQFGLNWIALYYYLFAILLLIISCIDMDTMIIPDALIFCCILFSVFSFLFIFVSFYERVFGFFALSLPFYLMNCIIPDSFGGGDIKLIAVCGFILGWQKTIIAGIIAILLAGVKACYLIYKKGENLQTHMAFAPYLCLGVYISLLYGYQMIYFYLY